MASIVGAVSIETGNSSLKAINGTSIFQGDLCIVGTDDGFYVYQLVDNNNTTEDIPYIVQPTSNGSNKRWFLRSARKFTEDVEFEKENFLKIREIKEKDTDGVIFTLTDGTEILRIDTTGVVINNNLTIVNDNINISKINDIQVSTFLQSNGSVPFTNQVQGIYPIGDADLTTKKYVDDEILGGGSVDLSDYIKFNNTTSYSPTGDYNPATKKFVEDEVSGITGTYMSKSIYDTNSNNVVDEAESITGQGSLATLSEVTSANVNSTGGTAGQALLSDGTNGSYWGDTLSTVTSANIDAETAPLDYVLVSQGDTTVKWQEMSGGGSGLPQILPSDISLDDTDIEVGKGNAFGISETIDFNTPAVAGDGGCWYTFQFPSTLDDTTDIDLDIFYNLNGNDNSKIVTIETKYYIYSDGETPSEGSPTGTNSSNISTGTGQDGAIRSYSLDSIPNASLTAGDTISLKFTRKDTDTYTGTFQMLYVFMNQN